MAKELIHQTTPAMIPGDNRWKLTNELFVETEIGVLRADCIHQFHIMAAMAAAWWNREYFRMKNAGAPNNIKAVIQHYLWLELSDVSSIDGIKFKPYKYFGEEA